MKAISAVIATIMLLMVTVSMIGVFYVFSSTMATTTTGAGSEQATQLTSQLSSCMRIDNINGNKIELRNCGKGVIDGKSLVVLMDDVKLNSSLQTIPEDSSGTVNVSGLWQFLGKHNLKISNGATFALALVDVQVNKDGLVGSWSFDEGSGIYAGDGSGSGNTGTIVDNEGDQWTDGKFNRGIKFDGVDDYVQISNPSQLPLGSSARSVFAWIKTSSGNKNILEYGSGGCNAQKLGLFINSAGDFRVATWCNDFTSPRIINDNSWHLVGFKIPGGTADVTVYIDETTYAGTFNGGFTPNTQAGPLVIASPTWGRFNGIIDEVRIWNRALSPDETVTMKQII